MILAGKDVPLNARVYHIYLGVGTLVSKRIGGGDVAFDGSRDAVSILDGGLVNGIKVLYAFNQPFIEFAHGRLALKGTGKTKLRLEPICAK